MAKSRLTRRAFLVTATTVGAAAMSGCPLPQQTAVVYRRSGRGRHVSQAAKLHNANRLYSNALVAALDKAHPGDTSKVVELTISRRRFRELFGNGRTIVDLRHV
ncbi:MAG TPA: twin-arginine translocation signal domain-containing protein [Candidatus Hydrogenedentes bacterium]|nr:twin-arginine translocation signal domain-containing protein [Candidatus Hydrogenedentota bacterium]HQH52338.1 twin-arginine translocation signal domain-containing protein [Candidatus Hydrogenedentota bacterium]HQM49424.1 twin-arginine translocation signal domain-containing protein [Candidatus Hydrogenedentota bacterium]